MATAVAARPNIAAKERGIFIENTKLIYISLNFQSSSFSFYDNRFPKDNLKNSLKPPKTILG